MILENRLTASVVTLPDGYKDPDECIRDKGIRAFKEITAKLKSAIAWVARFKVSKHSPNTEKKATVIYNGIHVVDTTGEKDTSVNRYKGQQLRYKHKKCN